MIISKTKTFFPGFTTRFRVAFAFFTAGFKTLVGTQDFGVQNVKKMSKKEYESFKLETINDLGRGKKYAQGVDFYSTLKF